MFIYIVYDSMCHTNSIMLFALSRFVFLNDNFVTVCDEELQYYLHIEWNEMELGIRIDGIDIGVVRWQEYAQNAISQNGIEFILITVIIGTNLPVIIANGLDEQSAMKV